MATLTSLQATLTAYETARDSILTGGNASYEIGDRKFTKLDLPFIESQIERLENKISALSQSGKLKFATAVFRGRR